MMTEVVTTGSEICPKPECKTFVHFIMRLLRTVILSEAKNLMLRPFVALRVTTLVCQSYAAWFRRTAGDWLKAPCLILLIAES